MSFDMAKRWSALPKEPTLSAEPWKESMGTACPHGLEFFLVDGTHIRNTYDSDFVQGGNPERYDFVPKGELWIDDSLPVEERSYVMFHECYETMLMEKGLDYDHAHDIAKEAEDERREMRRTGASMASASGQKWRSYSPGKFDSIVDSYVYQISMDGLGEEVGDVQDFGWYGRLDGPILNDVRKAALAAGDRLTSVETSELKPVVGAILHESDQGFVTVAYFNKRKQLMQAWDGVQEDAESFYAEAGRDDGE